jgi:hypothetical protein
LIVKGLRELIEAVVEGRARLRINLAARELEVEGSEAFVRSYAERFERLIEQLTAGRLDPPARPPATANGSTDEAEPQSFGELMHQMPRTASDVDRMLLAGLYAQGRNREQAFTTGEASGLLADQGIKIGNPSQSLRQNLNAKRVFKHQGRYRVSQIGLEHLKKIMGEVDLI